MSGYVRIHRSLLGHPAFRNESETMAFAWLIAKAAWRPARVRYKGHSINLRRGQLAISVRDMADVFDRDKAWITRLQNRLVSEAMIETRAETGVTVITICNYDEYQGDAEERETPPETQGETRGETDARQRRDTEQRREEAKKINTAAARAKPPEPKLPSDVRAILEAVTFANGPPGDLGYLRSWYEAGADLHQDIIPVLKREAAALDRKGHGKPRKLSVFDPAIREKLAADNAEIERLRSISRRYEAEEERAKSVAAGRS